jgi:hypothetical protein
MPNTSDSGLLLFSPNANDKSEPTRKYIDVDLLAPVGALGIRGAHRRGRGFERLAEAT